MTSKMMAFGTRTNAMFVRAPMKGLAAPSKGMVGSRVLTNGQLSMTRTKLYRRRFEFVFKGSEIELNEIRDFVEGQYGRGPFMFLHPRQLLGNVLPRSWSQPQLAVDMRGNAAMDFYSNSLLFGAPLSAQLNNPNEQPVTLTGLAGAPTTGLCLWSPSATAPVVPITNLTRPFHSILVPPNYLPRITVWGVRNSGSSPSLYYSLSNIPAATVAAGTAIAPVAGGTSVTPASSGVWRVLDLWIGSTGTALTDYTTFGAMDVRLGLGSAPALPTVFDFGRGQFPCMFTEDSVGEVQTFIGATAARSLYELDGAMEEVTQPW